MQAIWKKDVAAPAFKRLRGDIKTDVLIIGGGMAGILCAHKLQRAGIACVVAEAGRIGGGVTQNTTAKITAQHGAIYAKMLQRRGVELARLYYEAQANAIEDYRRLSRTVDYDFTDSSAYVYSLDNRRVLEAEAAALQQLGAAVSLEERVELPFAIAGAVRLEGQAQCHPLKLLYALAPSLTVFENTRVLELAAGGACTADGTIYAEKIIVATHFPFLNKHGAYFLKLYQHRSYVIALENAPPVQGMYVDEAAQGLSLRAYGNRLLVGGGGHRTGKPGGGWQELRAFAALYYPQAREVCHWATQDCKTLDDIPYIGRYAKHTPRLYVATGFNKWGMTSSMVAATLLTALVQGQATPLQAVFSPSRSMLYPQLAVNAATAVAGLLTPRAPRCPHLGCALHYNPQEHSWDCSCHGSRFAEDGRLLDNPATGDTVL